MTVREMLEVHPRSSVLDRDLLLRCIDECIECAATCTSCADADLAEPDVGEMIRCVRLCLDCADVCQATARILIRQTEPDLGVLRAEIGFRGNLSGERRGVREARLPPRALPNLRRGLPPL